MNTLTDTYIFGGKYIWFSFGSTHVQTDTFIYMPHIIFFYFFMVYIEWVLSRYLIWCLLNALGHNLFTRTFKPFNINLFLFKYSRVSLLCQVMFHLSLYMYRQMLSTSYISFLFLYDVYWMRRVLPCYLTWCLLNARACNLFTRTFKLFDIIFFFFTNTRCNQSPESSRPSQSWK